MATITFNAYVGAPAWTDIAANTLVFSDSLTDLTTAILVGAYQGGTHLGNGDPGTDQCGANHANNVMYVSGTEFNLNGGGTETLNDTNLTQTECTLRLDFTDAASVAISSARLYMFNGSVVTTEASNVIAYAFEQGVGASAWTKINEGGINYGGDNASERLDLGNKTAATSHNWYVAVSVSPEAVGANTAMDLGFALVYS